MTNTQKIIQPKEARENGLRFYFTGKPCKRGHVVLRYTKTKFCTECTRLRHKEYVEKNGEEIRARANAKRINNKEKLNAQERARYAKNPQKHIAKVKRQYENNGDKIRARRIAYHYEVYQNPSVREAAAKRTREWAAAHPDKVRANARNGKAKRKNVPGKHSAADIAAIKKMQKNKCAYCRVRLGRKYHIDHITPVSKGGTNDRCNLQIACVGCNLSKGARDPIFHAQTLGMLL
jgi:5-methylcytosine-specific restriction endonuclease McrA